MEMPVIDLLVSSLVLCALGTVITGASFTLLIVIATESESVPELVSVVEIVSVSEPL